MIRPAVPADLQQEFLVGEPAVKLRSQAAAYGWQASFLRIYAGDGAVFSIMDGDTVLAGDSEEARLFLTMDPSVRRVRTDEHTARRLAEDWGVPAVCGDVMTPEHPFAVTAATEPLTPREAWPVLQAAFGPSLPPFEAWYTDVSHRLRHGQCHLRGIKRDGRAVSCAMTTAQDDRTWLIGAVATHPDFRGQGLAGSVVTSLAAIGQEQNRQILLSPKNEYAARLYARLGFVPCGRYGQVAR